MDNDLDNYKTLKIFDMALIVAKFGGTSVADIERIERAAGKIAREVEAGNKVVVVVSAMSGVTNQLVEYCSDISPLYDVREYDAVVSSGEQITSGLMAMALQKMDILEEVEAKDLKLLVRA